MSSVCRVLLVLGCLALQLMASAVIQSGSALAAVPLPHDSLGVNFRGSPSDLATASAAGVGLARDEVIAGTNTDALVGLTAAAHLRLYPMLGLPRSQGPAADANALAAFVASFAQRYGREGTFWAQHPELPYLPVESYEIGNEPDITPTAPADQTSLHYADPTAFAQVYEAARTALHQVDPAAQAVVGGLLDSGSIGLDQAELYLRAIGPMDAVGYHPYLYDITRMQADTLALRQWLDANGHGGVPLDINEFGAAAGVTAGSAAWGAQVAQYTQWALCTPALHVENVQAFWWGAIPIADTDPWFSMVDSELAETPLGTAYLGEVGALTSQGCPAVATPTAPTVAHPAAPAPHTKARHKRKPAKNSHHHKRRHRPVKASHADKRWHRQPHKPAAQQDKPSRFREHR
jgi:hypothetical protein